MLEKKVKWTAIVLTCPTADWTQTLQKELELRQAKGYIDRDVFLLTVEDPKQGVGSGGATINALLTVAEYISARQGYSVLHPDVLEDAHILILHHSRTYAYDPCGRAFVTLPVKYKSPEYDGTLCVLDLLLKSITEKIAVQSAPGIWVSSTDMILTIPHREKIPWQPCDACVITVPSTPQYCRQHGVYKLNSEGYVEDILFQETVKNLEACERADGTVPVVCGLVYFSRPVADKLLSFFTKPPLDACTYFGVDSGEPPIRLSLFFDVMLPMCSGVNERDFRSGERSGSYGKQESDNYDRKTMRMARTILWKDLHGFKIKACMIETGDYVYPYTLQEHRKNILQRHLEACFPPDTLDWETITHSSIQTEGVLEQSCVVINSVLEGNVTVGSRSIVTNSCLQGDIVIGNESFIAGLITEQTEALTSRKERRMVMQFADSMIVQGFNIYLPTLGMNRYVMTTHGRFDDVQMPLYKGTSSFCNVPWLVLMNRTGITKEDLWGRDVEADFQTIMTARMFPVFHATDIVGLTEILWIQGEINDDNGEILNRWRSAWRLSLKEILSFVDMKKEFDSRRSLFYQVSQREISDALQNMKNRGFRSVYNAAVVEGYTTEILEALDRGNKVIPYIISLDPEEAASHCRQRLSGAKRMKVLFLMTSNADPEQTTCSAHCPVSEDHTSSLQAGIAARTLANVADVLGCMAGPKGGLRSGPAANKTWARAFYLLECGNITGGVTALAKERANWLDRPDKLIRAARHYEGAAQILIRHAVMTAKEHFVLTEEELPAMGQWVLAECPARIDVSGGWSDTPPITYEHGGAVAMVGLAIRGKKPIGAKARRIKEPRLVFVLHGSTEAKEIVCQELSDLEDYYQPHSPGALLKAAFVCADIVDLRSKQSLAEQLQGKYGGGFEVHSWSNLPQGSGLGTSSILAGVVMASVLKAGGKSCDTTGLIHLVLFLEQLLTTGGGWQDQVGGLCGGIRLGVSKAELPLYVDTVDLKPSLETVKAFNERLVLLYTGTTRLARNLLQDVVRNWYARNPQIVETEDSLVELATSCAKCFMSGDLDAVGLCMTRYWAMKKLMAPGCEPEMVTRLIETFEPFASGMCMAGAGGGGFMYVLARSASDSANIKQLVTQMQASNGVEVFEAEVDMEGLKVTLLQPDPALGGDQAAGEPVQLSRPSGGMTSETTDNTTVTCSAGGDQ